jgi:Fe-Mn family superoxide dismutase
MLPYAPDALEPHISEKALAYHFNRHHMGYVEKLNAAIGGSPYNKLPLEEIVLRSRKHADMPVFENSAQAWNHDFFWQSMSPNGGKPTGKIRNLLRQNYGGLRKFKQRFADTAANLFGSGWVWLVLDNGRLDIVAGSNAETPLGTHMTPLLVLDVWEHAYYLDYGAERREFVNAFLDNLINWDFAASNLEHADVALAA